MIQGTRSRQHTSLHAGAAHVTASYGRQCHQWWGMWQHAPRVAAMWQPPVTGQLTRTYDCILLPTHTSGTIIIRFTAHHRGMLPHGKAHHSRGQQ
jgi:hypothetical protein